MNIMQEALKLIDGDRQRDYGDMKESFQRIALLWSAYIGNSIDSLDVCKMMMLLKISRAKYNNHRDSYVDIIGYVECAERLINQIENEKKESVNHYSKIPHHLLQTEEN